MTTEHELNMAAAKDLCVQALRGVMALCIAPGESSSEQFERVAEWYYRETRKLRPGKDVSPLRPEGSYEERFKAFDDWHKSKIALGFAALKALEIAEATER